MAVYPPPNFTEYISTFNPENWVADDTGAIDTAFLDDNYAKYPVIQGSNYTLKNTLVQGDLAVENNTTLVGNLIYEGVGSHHSNILIDTYNKGIPNVNIGITDTALNDEIDSQSSVIIGVQQTQGAIPIIQRSILIGANILNDPSSLQPIVATDFVADTVAIGNRALYSSYLQDDASLNKENVVVGGNSCAGLREGEINTAIGFDSGNGNGTTTRLLTGNTNTFLGARTGIDTTLSNISQHSTAVGADALITDDNQIQLGTGTDYVNIPNYIKFSDGSTLSSATSPSGVIYQYFYTFTASPQTIGISETKSNYNVTYNPAVTPGTLSLRLPAGVGGYDEFINIYNNSTNNSNISLNANFVGRTFSGRFGTGTNTLIIRPLNWVSLSFDPPNNTWSVISKSFVNTVEDTLTALLPTIDALNVSLANTLIRITTNTSPTPIIYLADTALKPFNKNAYFYIENTTATAFNLNSVSNTSFTPSTTTLFTGLYGSGTASLVIPPQSTFTIFISNAGSFVVQQRFQPTQSYTVAYTGTPITTYQNSQYFDTLINLTGTVATDFYLPDPRTSVNAFSKNRSITINNDGSGLLTVFATNGNFGGTHGNSLTAIYLPDSVSYTFFCNGTTWEINQRSDGITYQNLGVVLSSVNYAGNYNYLGATLNISSTTAGTLAYYPSPQASQAHLTTSIVRNVGLYNISLQIATGTFTGLYGGNTNPNSLIIPAGTWVKLFSDGTDYLVVERSVENQRNAVTASGSTVNLSSNPYLLNCDLLLTPDINNRIFNLVNPVNYPNQGYKIYNSSSVFTLALNTPSGNFSGNARYSSGVAGNLENVPPNSWLQLYSDGTNWRITDKSATNQIFDYNISTSLTIDRNFQLNSDINLTGSGGTLTIYNPTANFVADSYLKIFNKGTGTITASPTGGSSFLGIYGSGSASLIIPQNSWVKIVSNGTNWLCDERSEENQIYYPSAFTTGTETIATNFQYLNSELHLTSTFAGSVALTIPAVSVTQTLNQKYIIYNDNSLLATPNSNPIVLTSTGTSYFRGAYQNNASGATQLTYTLAPNSKVEFYNNGTNWVVTDIGETGNQLAPIRTSNPATITRPFRKNYIISNNVGGPNQGFTLPAPLASDVGTEIFIRKGWNYPGVSSSFYLDNNSTTAPPSTTNPIYTLLSTIAQPAIASGNVLGSVLGARFTVFQYGYAGTGNIAFVNGSSTCTVTGISASASISHYQPIVLTGAPVASVLVNERPTGGGTGGNGTYILTTAWTNPDGNYSFTISDFYAWTQIQ